MNLIKIFLEICIKSDCKCKNSQLCINDFVKEKFCSNDYWIDSIVKTSDQIKVYKKVRQRKALVKSHRDLLVRWLVQLNQKGEDSYSFFRSLQSDKPNLEHLKYMDNCLFSMAALDLILEGINNNGSLVKMIHFEHNPPVKAITTFLDRKKCINVEGVKKIFSSKKYCVMIISKEERDLINQKGYSQKGSFDQRFRAAKIKKLYRINPES